MALNREQGEHFDGLRASMHVVIEPRALANMTAYRSEYRPKKKFMTVERAKETVELPVFEVAMKNAIDAFKAKGALWPVRFDETSVLVQAYPNDLKLAVTFQRMIAGTTHYSTTYFDLPKPVLDALLEASGKKAPTAH